MGIKECVERKLHRMVGEQRGEQLGKINNGLHGEEGIYGDKDEENVGNIFETAVDVRVPNGQLV